MTSTAATFTPQGSVCSSMMRWQLLVDLVARGEEVVQLHLAEHAPERRLRDLRGGVEVVLDLIDRLVAGRCTRKKITALTLIETLSRVMTSCGGTSMATVRRLTFTILSMKGISSTRPGPCRRRPG